jgi:Ca2+-binding RTX toxin-like protein
MIPARLRRSFAAAALTALPSIAALAVSGTASAAVTASFTPPAGVLTVFADNVDNTIVVSRTAAGSILINGGSIAVAGGTPTVANVSLIQIFGLGGNDRLILDEASGALPRASLFGGFGDDALTGGSGADQLFGQGGRDTLLSRGGIDFVSGGDDNDTLFGGDADDHVVGETGDDLIVWQSGDDNDLNEGGEGQDTVRVEATASSETFALTANGLRARFVRLTPSPFAIDLGSVERFELNAAGGNDRFDGGSGLGTITLNVSGGTGNDRLVTHETVDVLLGGDGEDRLEAGAAADLVLPGTGDDVALGGPGADTLNGDTGDDILLGGRGADRIIGGPGFDTVVGGPGVDTATEAEDVTGVP